LTLFILCGLISPANTQTHAIDGEYIKEWLVLGPFFPNDLLTDFLANVGREANVQPNEGDTVTTLSFHRNSALAMETKAGGSPLMWKRYRCRADIIDLVDAVGFYEKPLLMHSVF